VDVASAVGPPVYLTGGDNQVFVDPAGCNHQYKEFEMNAKNTTWDLLLNRPYNNGGTEDSRRIDPINGWTMLPPLYCAGTPRRHRQPWAALDSAYGLRGSRGWCPSSRERPDQRPRGGERWLVGRDRTAHRIADGAAGGRRLR